MRFGQHDFDGRTECATPRAPKGAKKDDSGIHLSKEYLQNTSPDEAINPWSQYW